jgi:hypothetical protein
LAVFLSQWGTTRVQVSGFRKTGFNRRLTNPKPQKFEVNPIHLLIKGAFLHHPDLIIRQSLVFSNEGFLTVSSRQMRNIIQKSADTHGPNALMEKESVFAGMNDIQ